MEQTTKKRRKLTTFGFSEYINQVQRPVRFVYASCNQPEISGKGFTLIFRRISVQVQPNVIAFLDGDNQLTFGPVEYVILNQYVEELAPAIEIHYAGLDGQKNVAVILCDYC